jgi:hypothetical protein
VNKRNLIIQAAVAGLFSVATLSAYASGSLSNAIGNSAQIATQAVAATSVIGSGSIQYTVEGAIPVGTYYVYVQLNGGATFAAATGPVAVLAGALVSAGGVTTISNGVVLANTSIVAFPVSVTTAMPANSTFTFKPLGVAPNQGAIANATTVATPGSSLNATMSLGASASYAPTLTTIVQDEATASTAPIATFVSGITATALSSGLFTTAPAGPAPFTGVTETAVINVISGAGTALSGNANVGATGTELLDLGGFYFKDVSSDATTTNPGTGADSPPFAGDALTTFNIANFYGASVAAPLTAGTINATVTAPAGFFSVAGVAVPPGAAGKVFLASNPTCAAQVGASATVTAGGSVATFAAIPVQLTDVPLYVCVQANVPDTVLWTAGTPSLVANLVSGGGVGAPVIAPVALTATNLYPLGSNGGTVIVREYVPAAATATTGYQSFIRVINTGSVASTIGFAFIDDTAGGSAGARGLTTTAVPAGGAITLTSAQIEALAGIAKPASVNARPRVQVTASTTITVQSYLYNAAANVFTEVSGGSNGNGGSGIISATGQ